MNIRKKIDITAGITVLLLGCMILLLVIAYRERTTIQSVQGLTHDMKMIIYDLTLLRGEHLLHQDRRSQLQMESKLKELERLIGRVGGAISDDEGKNLLSPVAVEVNTVSSILRYLKDIRGKNGIAPAEDRAYSDGEKRLITQLIIHSHYLDNNLNRFHELIDKKSDRSRGTTAIIIFTSMGLAVLIAAGVSLSVRRIITSGITELLSGAGTMGSGNLDHRMVLKGDNEFTGLARAFNDMAERLKISHTSVENLEKEISLRRDAEERMARSLREKEVLIKEIQHRTKNNMEVIISLLSLHGKNAGGKNMDEVIGDIQERIMAMSLIHEMLYRSSSLSAIDLNEYARALGNLLLVTHQKPGQGVTMEIGPGECTVSIDSAVPCGLVINELITNSLKHAFPEQRDGMIDLDFNAGENGIISFTVKDNGTGLPENFDPAGADTLGLPLAWKLVTLQLRGEMEINRNGGTEVKVTFRDSHKGRV